MKFEIPDCKYYLVDIDGTLTDYREGSITPERLLHGNFLFPIIRDLMLERGWEKSAAEDAIAELTGKIVYWDYTDFIAEFNLPADEAFRRMKAWHAENLIRCDDGISLVHQLIQKNKKLFIMSNNPYIGCIFKLQAAGLASDDFSSPCFRRIFGTNVLRGCKNSVDVWKRALAQIPADPSEICVVGDNPKEDRDIPFLCGIKNAIILPRKKIASGIENTKKKESK